MDSKDQESRPKLRVHYCPQCGWLARAAWVAQELLQTFSDDVAECALVPDKPGTFEVWAGNTRVWTREKGTHTRDQGAQGPSPRCYRA